jgi:SOS response regulatory protein OraA/RecX
MFKITSLRASDGGGAVRIDIKRDSERKGECLYILASHQREYEFAKGDYPDEAYTVLCRLDGICRGVRSGRRILGYGANSKSALRMKLIGKGITPEDADEAVEILISESGINEESDAMRLCELQIAKNIGARRILSYLRGRGYTDDSLSEVKEYLSEVDFVPICRKAIEKKYGGLPTDFDIKKKCIDYLLRQGFSYNEIKKAFEN